MIKKLKTINQSDHIRHDINHNISVILEANKLLFQDNEPTELSRELHQAIVSRSKDLQNLINQLFDLCQVDKKLQIDFGNYILRRKK
ncbi:MAG: hypothetical protein H6624_16885 [Bdellovibrionaceae bacterium]|nr:hypothetical protein [Bdellovibrionales bacterium]MCB9086022.1 hypothetical protein [Pseudobdellovibrionaceae bacterium]